MAQKTITFDGEPYYLHERGSGIFQIIKSIQVDINGNHCESFGNFEGELERGLDILETPNRGLSLILRVPKNGAVMIYAMEELKKCAIVSDHNYFSHEGFGNTMANYLGKDGEREVYEVKPRLFRKIVNN